MIPHHIRLDTVAQWCRAHMGEALDLATARAMFSKPPSKAQMENTFHRATDFVDFSLTKNGLVYETPEVRKARLQSERKAEVSSILSRLEKNEADRIDGARLYAQLVENAEKERKQLLQRLCVLL